jgi:glutaryl-CoA dehydrogenase
MHPILAFGSDEQKQRWLPPMARGELLGCYGLTEPDGGSDPGTMKTRAVRDGSDWVLNGAKMWITNGTIADVAIVWAVTEEGIRGFLVEKEMPGYTTRDIQRKYSLRSSVTSELFFDNVRLPQENMLPNVRGLRGPLDCLTEARFGIAWGAVGAAIACFQEVLEYSKVRILFGRPMSHTQTIQRRLADMCRQITTSQLLALQLGRLKDQGAMHHSQVSLAKWNNARMALDVARDARDMLGAAGISIEFSPIRHMLNLESVVTYEGTETIHELVLGRELAGQAAF